MRKLAKNMLLLTILVSGTQVIDIPLLNLTLFQIVLILSGFVVLLDIIRQGKIYKGKYLFLGICYLFSSIMAFFLSTYPSWAKSYLLLGLMTTMIILAFPNEFDINDIPLLEKTLIRSQYIVIPFSIYSIYMYYFQGGLPKKINLLGGMSVTLDDDFIQRAQAASQVRLSLPYATPPVLSIVMAVCLVILITNAQLFSKKVRYSLIVIYAFVLFFTGSRSGVLGLIVALFVWYIEDIRNKKMTKTKLFIFVAIAAAVIGVIIILSDTIYFRKLYGRTFSMDILTDRHFLVPLDGIIIWLSSIKNFVFGIGFGSSFYMTGMHTVLPAYFLNSFVTLIAERGILGLFIVFELLSFLYYSYLMSKKGNSHLKALFYGYLCCLVPCMTYEALNCYFLIFVLAIVPIQFVSCSKLGTEANTGITEDDCVRC